MGFGQGDSIATPHLIDVGVDEGIVVVQIDLEGAATGILAACVLVCYPGD